VQNQLKANLGIRGLLLMYVGNLEPYQGIDLLLESFALVITKTDLPDLVIIGGKPSDIDIYEKKTSDLCLQNKVHFLGAKPLDQLATFLAEADVLVSPRVKGNNTPMKIYSYLHSGKPILATNLPTHTQVLDESVAVLAEPYLEAFSNGMLQLIKDKMLRVNLGSAGRKLVEERYTFDIFRKTLRGLFDWLESELTQGQKHTTGTLKRPVKNSGL
jgi:glycosyltransferase involved in cell wall biosynthesis